MFIVRCAKPALQTVYLCDSALAQVKLSYGLLTTSHIGSTCWAIEGTYSMDRKALKPRTTPSQLLHSICFYSPYRTLNSFA